MNISNSFNSDYTIDGYTPLRLKIYFTEVNFTPKTKSIKCIWGDGTETFYNYDLNSNSSLVYTDVFHDYFIEDHKVNYEDKKITIVFSFFGTSDTVTYNIDLKILKPNINEFFGDFKLVKTRMFGPNNTLIYVFETKNPDNVLMSTINWETSLEKTKKEILPPVRFYQFLPAIEHNFANDIDKNKNITEDIAFQNSNNQTPSKNTVDRGGNT